MCWKSGCLLSGRRSQYIIEGVFKEMKGHDTGTWWPLNHWTDSKIRVHALYCTIALLLRALLYRRVRQAGLKISLPRMLSELDGIREVVTIFPRQRRRKIERRHTVLTKTPDLQQRLLSTLEMEAKTTV
ncbi:MAG: hypothetical protein ACQESR_23780 [Planctomycetota bacterium]